MFINFPILSNENGKFIPGCHFKIPLFATPPPNSLSLYPHRPTLSLYPHLYFSAISVRFYPQTLKIDPINLHFLCKKKQTSKWKERTSFEFLLPFLTFLISYSFILICNFMISWTTHNFFSDLSFEFEHLFFPSYFSRSCFLNDLICNLIYVFREKKKKKKSTEIW